MSIVFIVLCLLESNRTGRYRRQLSPRLILAVRPIHPRLLAPDVQPHSKAKPDDADYSRVHGVRSLRVDARKPKPPHEVESASVFSIMFRPTSRRNERMRPNKAVEGNSLPLSLLCIHGFFAGDCASPLSFASE